MLSSWTSEPTQTCVSSPERADVVTRFHFLSSGSMKIGEQHRPSLGEEINNAVYETHETGTISARHKLKYHEITNMKAPICNVVRQ